MAGELIGSPTTSLWHDPAYSVLDAHLVPLSAFVVKVAGRCNIDCDYCFMYHGEDQSWVRRPKIMSTVTATAVAACIRQHVEVHGIPRVQIALHGGEPLMLGRERVTEIVRIFREAIPCVVEIGVQTNGTLIDEAWVRLFDQLGISVGLSLDGPKAVNDLHRLYRNGKSSFPKTMSGLSALLASEAGRRCLSGVLTVVNPTTDPGELLAFFDRSGIHNIDLLLPHGTYDTPPIGMPDPLESDAYARWMIRFFDHWFADFAHIKVRYLEEIVAMLLGGASRLEAIGAHSVNLVIFETDGEIEALDSLKVAGQEATALGLNATDHSLDDALAHPAIYSRMMGVKALSQACRDCPEVQNCAGGYLPHRFSSRNGFQNPTVYCANLKLIFEHIRRTVFAPASMVA
jgi:uncharacterized protein